MFLKLLYKLPAYALSFVCGLVILYLTLVPKPLPDTDISLFVHADKVVHAIMFGVMYFCLYMDYSRRRREFPVRRCVIIIAIVATIVFGGVVELLQDAMGLGRGGDIFDFLADIAGVLISAWLCRYVRIAKN